MNIHLVAIGGSIMHQLAIALYKRGFTVSGSDDVIYDPAKSKLETHDLLPKQFGWFVDNIHPQLDAVIVGMHAKSDNPELLKAQALGLPIYSYPEYIYQQSMNKQRVVVAGSHGKTTITAMIMHVLHHYQHQFDYLVGAKLDNFDFSVQLSKQNKRIIIEGDEYLSSPIHRVPKIFYYKPHIALISGVAWDHINVFPTEKYYINQFKIFIEQLPLNCTLVYNAEDAIVLQLIKKNAQHLHCVAYKTPAYQVNAAKYQVLYENKTYDLQIFGMHNMQNMAGAQKVCELMQIDRHDFYQAMQLFSGAARRLQKLGQANNTSIIKDFAHAPSKVKASTKAVKALNPARSLLAIFELHTYSSLNKDFIPEYEDSLTAADEAIVYFDKATFDVKKLPDLAPETIKDCFKHLNLKVFTKPKDLHLYLINKKSYADTNVLLMSSGNFGKLNLTELTKLIIEKS